MDDPKPVKQFLRNSKSRTTGTSRLLVASEAERRLRIREKNTSLRSRKFATSVIAKQNCSQGASEIRLDALAAELGVPVERLQPLLDHEYLSRTSLHTVIKPQPAAMAWLRQMFLPLTMRPWLPEQMVADLLQLRVSQVRTLCLMYDVPLQDDPAFGCLMSLTAFYRLYCSLQQHRDPARFDRQAMLSFLIEQMKMHGPRHRPLPKLPYSKRLEAEISRISRLPEPERTFRSTALLDAYRDAKGVADVFARYKGATVEEMPEVARLEELVERSVGA